MDISESNPATLARALDRFLDHEVQLIIYGRAAIALGFENPPPATLKTFDIDAIIRTHTIEELSNDENFWNAKDEVNELFKDRGLYITHLFGEEQVFLRNNWKEHVVPITSISTENLQLFRPAAIDLVLTKMMRGDDEQDMEDARFLINHDRITREQLIEAFAMANLTDTVELHDAFERAKPIVLEIAEESAKG